MAAIVEGVFKCLCDVVVPACEKVCDGSVSCDLKCGSVCELKESVGLCQSSGSCDCCCGFFKSAETNTLLSHTESGSMGGVVDYSRFSQVGADGVSAGEQVGCCGKVCGWACNNFCCTVLCCKPERQRMG